MSIARNMPNNDMHLSDNDMVSRALDPRAQIRGRVPIRPGGDERTRRIGFLLVPDFAMIAYSCAMEPYRAANALAGRRLYSWTHASPDGKPVYASNGLAIVPDQGIAVPIEVDDLFVCAGGNPTLFDDPATFAWLRAQAHRGVRIGGISGGPFLLARAGLLAGYRCTLHWEYEAALREEFPRLDITRNLFEIDRARCTSSGGTAALDMMAALIAVEHGKPLARAVSEWFLHTQIRQSAAPQRMKLRERYNVSNPTVLATLERIERSLEEPETREALADAAGVSLRQLERLFKAHLGRTLHEHYLDLRLERARALVTQTAMPVIEVAFACGFVSAPHFSRTYKARFGLSPAFERRRF
jgi:transcriptional regulator GlxA family with amidase domain